MSFLKKELKREGVTSNKLEYVFDITITLQNIIYLCMYSSNLGKHPESQVGYSSPSLVSLKVRIQNLSLLLQVLHIRPFQSYATNVAGAYVMPLACSNFKAVSTR